MISQAQNPPVLLNPYPQQTLNISIAKRLPYADHIIALDSNGKIAEQGTFEALNKTGGYISSFNLSQSEPDKPQEQDEPTSAITYSKSFSESKVTEEGLQAEASRRTGDAAIYLYYINAVGWVPTVIFIVSITIFIFGISFPSKFFVFFSRGK